MTEATRGKRRLAIGLSAGIGLFVLGTAIFTGNSGLYILAGLSAAATLGLLATPGKR